MNLILNSIDEITHYERLDIAANASSSDIQNAYREILSIYDMDSLSTYSLFTPLEREKILAQAKAAFQTLADKETRKVYDALLLASGRLSPEMLR